jgi:methionyl-tRNA synthetase
MSRCYITTPIYYVNSDLHLGHAYTTVLADVLARYHRLLGHRTRLLTGTDEHGQKVHEAAARLGLPVREHCDEMSARYQVLWHKLGIGHDRFIRTTDPDHVALVQRCLQRLHDEGHLYTQDYEGWYDVKSERYFTEKDLIDGRSPDGNEVEKLIERNWFFRMSAFQERLVEHIQQHPGFIQPEHRRNEVLGFLRQPLQDLCISRPKSRMDWGIELPFDRDFVCYVWVDALLNYVTGSGEPGRETEAGEWWPADVHLLGKDILITHSVYWSTLLMALGLPLPVSLLVHGWWLVDNQKMSKSEGNVVNPLDLIDHIGVDAFRYFLIREMVPGSDCSFSFESIARRLNTDLANDLGNLLSRVTNLAERSLGGHLPAATGQHTGLRDHYAGRLALWPAQVEAFNLHGLVEDLLGLVREANRQMELHAPWKALRSQPETAAAMLADTAEVLRLSARLLEPVMPGLARTILDRLGAGADGGPLEWCDNRPFRVTHGEPVFPRIDTEAFLAALGVSRADSAPAPAAPAAPVGGEALDTEDGLITFEDFGRARLRAARILEAERVPGANRLLRLQIDTGTDRRQIVAGIAEHYEPADLPGRMICVVANLVPAVIRGVESRGMLLASKHGKTLVLVDPGPVPPGSSIG